MNEIKSCNNNCSCCNEHVIIENENVFGFDSQEANKHFNNL